MSDLPDETASRAARIVNALPLDRTFTAREVILVLRAYDLAKAVTESGNANPSP